MITALTAPSDMRDRLGAQILTMKLAVFLVSALTLAASVEAMASIPSYLGKDCDPDARGSCGQGVLHPSGLTCVPSCLGGVFPPPPATCQPKNPVEGSSCCPEQTCADGLECKKTTIQSSTCEPSGPAYYDGSVCDPDALGTCGSGLLHPSGLVCTPSKLTTFPKPPATCQPM